MSGSIAIKRTAEKGTSHVLKHGVHVADIYRSTPDTFGHRPTEPWVLETVSGRIDRFALKQEAADEAQKI